MAMCVKYLVYSIDDIAATMNSSRTFIGLTVMPIFGNAVEFVEFVTAVVISLKKGMDPVLLVFRRLNFNPFRVSSE